MARSGTRVVDQPHSESSSYEDDETSLEEDGEQQVSEGNGEEEGSESEGEEVGKAQTQSTPSIPKPKEVQKPQISSESESDSESGNEFTIKPVLSQKATESTPKRTLDDAKKKKNKKEDSPPKTHDKKYLGNRVFSDHDQIALLQGMIAYQSQKRADPYSDISGFYDFVKGALNADVSKAQVKEKIRRLRTKFLTRCEKGNASSSNPTDAEMFSLSKEIWGSSGVAVEQNGGKEKKNLELKDKNGSNKKNVEAPLDSPKNESVKKKEGKRKRSKDEKNADEKKRQKTAQDEQHTASAVEGNDLTAGKVNRKLIGLDGIAEVEVEKVGNDFMSKYPLFINSFNAKYYPMIPEEALLKLKEKATSLDGSVAEKVEKKWANVWEEYSKLGGMVAELVSLQARLVRGEEVTL